MSIRPKILFLFILLLAFFFRFYGIDWDNGAHLHPDERMIIMVSERLRLPTSASDILSCLPSQTIPLLTSLFPSPTSHFPSPTSNSCSLNPHFFAYGSFPLYLLKATGTFLTRGDYDGLLYVGRMLSVFFDLVTVILVYKISSLIISKVNPSSSNSSGPLVSALAAFLYTISILPIQASHFYAVDIMLTTLSTLTLYRLLKLLEKPTIKNASLTGIALGLALATKITMILLLTPIVVTLLFLYWKTRSIKKILITALIIFTSSFLIFTLAMPYALISFTEFKSQLLEQLKMNSNPYIFPFTLQYVGTAPYLYYLKNILLWGLGIPYAVMAFVGVIVATFFYIIKIFKAGDARRGSPNQHSLLILLIFFWVYFLVVGKSAVKFMRYLLPLYPFFAIFTAYIISQLFKYVQSKSKFLLLNSYFLILLFLVWPSSFLSIYTKPNTRLAATEWIIRNIPPGSRLGIEHWDDRLPLVGQDNYLFNELTLYDFDNLQKWETLSQKISQTDYLILASNRLYVPLPKLTDCTVHKNYCYPYTANYYQKLFAEKLGFRLSMTFSSYPTIPLLNTEIVDDSADESFTVYDHPKILIFKNEARFTEDELLNLVTNH